MLMPKNQGKNLFSNAICQSGSPVKDLSLLQSNPDSRIGVAKQLAKEVGCHEKEDSDQVGCFLNVILGAYEA